MSDATTIRFGVITDSHVAPPGLPPFRFHGWYRLDDSLERLRRAVDVCVGAAVDALLCPGDMSHAGDRASLDAVVGVLAESGRPTWIAGGNHDTKGGPEVLDQALADALTGPVRGVRRGGEMVGPIVLAGGHARALGDRRYRTEPPEGQLAGPLVVWLSHFPTIGVEGRLQEHGIAYAGDALNREDIETALAGSTSPTVALSGHLHVRDAVADGSLLQVSCAALVEPPCEITIIDVRIDGHQVDLDIACHSVDDPGAGTLPVISPATTAWSHRPGTGWLRLPVR